MTLIIFYVSCACFVSYASCVSCAYFVSHFLYYWHCGYLLIRCDVSCAFFFSSSFFAFVLNCYLHYYHWWMMICVFYTKIVLKILKFWSLIPIMHRTTRPLFMHCTRNGLNSNGWFEQQRKVLIQANSCFIRNKRGSLRSCSIPFSFPLLFRSCTLFFFCNGNNKKKKTYEVSKESKLCKFLHIPHNYLVSECSLCVQNCSTKRVIYHIASFSLVRLVEWWGRHKYLCDHCNDLRNSCCG